MAPELSRVIRLDSMPLFTTQFTEEGYLIDRPILTSTGIFEYKNPDGSIRRELRIPEEVFSPESLASYKGKPIIITHGAGVVDKDNVHEHSIGTILSEGYRSGDDVRAEIIIHDMDAQKKAGLKELSLGYNLTLDETPGEWNGQHYDAIQREIRINHLALVGVARAGEQARLNIDGRDENILEGGKKMSEPKKAKDGVMDSEEFAKAIDEFKDKQSKKDSDPVEEPVVSVKPEETVAEDGKDLTDEEKIQAIKDRIAQDGCEVRKDDIDALLGIIEKMKGEKQEKKEDGADCDDPAKCDGEGCDDPLKKDGEEEPKEEEPVEENTDGCESKKDGDPAEPVEEPKTDGDDEPVTEPDKQDGEEPAEGEEVKTDGEEPAVEEPKEEEKQTNADAADLIRQHVKVAMVGKSLNLDGLEDMDIMSAKKAVISAVRPNLRLDGVDDAFINAAYEFAVDDVNARNQKDTGFQKKQMFNADSSTAQAADETSAEARRRHMIERQQNKNKEEK